MTKSCNLNRKKKKEEKYQKTTTNRLLGKILDQGIPCKFGRIKKDEKHKIFNVKCTAVDFTRQYSVVER